MSPVKRQKDTGTVPYRVHAVRAYLGGERGELTQEELYERLRRRFAGSAPSFSTVKRWEQGRWGKIKDAWAKQLALIADCSPGWIMFGDAPIPAWYTGPEPALQGQYPLTWDECRSMLAEAIPAAIEHTLRMNELDSGNRKGREFVLQWLKQTADEFQKYGADVSDLWKVIAAIEAGRL